MRETITRLQARAKRVEDMKSSADQIVAEAEQELKEEEDNLTSLTRYLDELSKEKFKMAQVRLFYNDDDGAIC